MLVPGTKHQKKFDLQPKKIWINTNLVPCNDLNHGTKPEVLGFFLQIFEINIPTLVFLI
jgi:hypothetical protein